MNFNSYDFDFQNGGGQSLIQYDETADKQIAAELKADFSDVKQGLTTAGKTLEDAGCVGEECCGPNTTYNKKTDKCIPHTSSNSQSSPAELQ